MKNNEPVDPRIRLAISQWPDSAPRGSVTTFCAEHEISRNTFYRILNKARKDGPAAVLEPGSRRPARSPSRIAESVKDEALKVRSALEASGLDYGPISVYEKMNMLGLEAPSVASLARIFREKGVARAEPNKRPRAAWRRFVYPAPNACWQLDATEYVLSGGRKAVIFQLQDDHSRLAIASLVAKGETSAAAIAVMRKGITKHGVPQRLLTDNGRAMNTTRQGFTGELVDFVTSYGIQAITGKPGRPTTQGKNERFHQTLMRWLDKQPLTKSLEALQAQVDAFDDIYNTQRPHQGLPGRSKPIEIFNATPPAEPPRPAPIPNEPIVPNTAIPVTLADTARAGEYPRKVRKGGVVTVRKVIFNLGKKHENKDVIVIVENATATFYDTKTGEYLDAFHLPPPGVRSAGKKYRLSLMS